LEITVSGYKIKLILIVGLSNTASKKSVSTGRQQKNRPAPLVMGLRDFQQVDMS
jgi:hypothetical protein